jgi:hypothetical protein
MSNDDSPLYPMSLYIYDEAGFYSEPVHIASEAQLYGPGVRAMILAAMARHVEIRITDPGDLMLFHAKDGKILFDGKEIKECARRRTVVSVRR